MKSNVSVLYDGQGVQFSTFAKKHVKWHLLLKQYNISTGVVRISPWLWGFLYLADLEIGYNHVIFASLEHTLNIYPPSWPIIFYVPSSKVRFPFGFSSYSGTLSLLYQETCSSYSCSALPKFPELSTLELPLNCSSSSIYGNTRVNFCLAHPRTWKRAGLETGYTHSPVLT